ncbi:DUF1887 family protein, partial [Vibrio splendidus]
DELKDLKTHLAAWFTAAGGDEDLEC